MRGGGTGIAWLFLFFLKETSFQNLDSQNPVNAKQPCQPSQNPRAQVIETEIPGPSCLAKLPELVSTGFKQETPLQYIRQRVIWEVSTLTSDLHEHIHHHANMLVHIYTATHIYRRRRREREGETPVTLTQLLGHCVDTKLY